MSDRNTWVEILGFLLRSPKGYKDYYKSIGLKLQILSGLCMPLYVVDDSYTVKTKTVQYRLPKSKKNRIKKKFKKDSKNWKTVVFGYQCYDTPNGIAVPSVIYNEIFIPSTKELDLKNEAKQRCSL